MSRKGWVGTINYKVGKDAAKEAGGVWKEKRDIGALG